MELNGAELNAVELNGSTSGSRTEPSVVAPVFSAVWGVLLLLDGVDTTDLLTGLIRIERQEGARCLADFSLLLGAGPVNPAEYIGKEVELHYQVITASEITQVLRFRGKIERPLFNLQNRVLSCECSDQLHEMVEPMSITAIDALVGGQWSPDVFEPVAGRSRWDYAMERMSTRAASLQRNVEGALQVTSWAAKTVPDWLIPPGTVMFRSIDWLPAELTERVNVVEIEADYRFIRLRERHQAFSWRHPDIAGDSIESGFCIWRHDSTELPDISMVQDANESAGYTSLLDGAFWLRLPPSGVYCTPPAGWRNEYPDLLLRATWTSAYRWAQRVTEQYKLRVEAPASVAQAGEVIGRDRVALDTESDREQAFLSASYTAPEADAVEDALGDFVVDVRSETRRGEAIGCLLAMASTSIWDKHRGNRFAFQLPTMDGLGIRLEHTVQVDDVILSHPIVCKAKVFSILDELDLDSGACLTTFQLAVSQGGGADSDPLTPPAIPASTPPGTPPAEIELPTQLGGRNESPIYDDALKGFSGNYDENDLDINPDLELFPRRFDFKMPEIPATHMDEYPVSVAQTYRVQIPNDLLEL
ncbi:hypothetical protein [Pseudomonas sp. BN515]|uniref:hypothetical protein n=1 Tax=Pseudomonas sp. BN515 TaxID=2567892 RepID=UPI002457A5E3|nr:hypothetical protein [Pseudomonas sp. BN515]MDH4873012.1 hypothetical protein [Pseudomonas sp. BN515]